MATPQDCLCRKSKRCTGMLITCRSMIRGRRRRKIVQWDENKKKFIKRCLIRAGRIFETVLYADDLAAAERFYRDALGLEVIQRGSLVAAFRCSGGVLLIFDSRKSVAAGRDVPSHGTSGAGHIAFAAKPENLDAWRLQLHEAGIPIEHEMEWPEGGRSIYFRDPAGNVV